MLKCFFSSENRLQNRGAHYTSHACVSQLLKVNFLKTSVIIQITFGKLPSKSHAQVSAHPQTFARLIATVGGCLLRGFIRRRLPAIYRHLFCLEPPPILTVTSSNCGLKN